MPDTSFSSLPIAFLSLALILLPWCPPSVGTLRHRPSPSSSAWSVDGSLLPAAPSTSHGCVYDSAKNASLKTLSRYRHDLGASRDQWLSCCLLFQRKSLLLHPRNGNKLHLQAQICYCKRCGCRSVGSIDRIPSTHLEEAFHRYWPERVKCWSAGSILKILKSLFLFCFWVCEYDPGYRIPVKKQSLDKLIFSDKQ